MSQSKSSAYILVGIVASVLGAICFSTKAVIVKLAYRDFPVDAISLLALRMMFSLPFFLASAWISSSSNTNVRFSKVQWLQVAVVGCLGYYVSSLLDFEGLKYIPAGIERLILFAYPTFVLLISALWFRKPVRSIEWIALLITYAGLALAFAGEVVISNPGQHFFFGSILILICAVTYAIYIAGSGALIPVIGAVKFNSYAMAFAAAGVLVHFMIQQSASLAGLPWEIYAYGFLMAVLSTVIPSYLVSISIKRLGANTTAIIASLGPVSTIAQAWFLLDESVSVVQIAGTVFILAGILLISWKSRKMDPTTTAH